MSNKTNPWIQKLNTDLRNKVTFDVHPTNPQVDIQPTGSCEFCIRNVDFVSNTPRPTIEQPSHNTNLPPLILPEICSSRVACIYSTDGKCQGLMTPERLNILRTAFHTAKHNGLHNNITTTPKSFARELLGLLNKARKEIPQQEDQGFLLASFAKSCTRCPQKMGSGNSGKMASPLDFNPSYSHYWSADSRDALFGAHFSSLSSQSTGFSVCHSIYNEQTMNLSLRHAIYSAILSTEATVLYYDCLIRPYASSKCCG